MRKKSASTAPTGATTPKMEAHGVQESRRFVSTTTEPPSYMNNGSKGARLKYENSARTPWIVAGLHLPTCKSLRVRWSPLMSQSTGSMKFGALSNQKRKGTMTLQRNRSSTYHQIPRKSLKPNTNAWIMSTGMLASEFPVRSRSLEMSGC